MRTKLVRAPRLFGWLLGTVVLASACAAAQADVYETVYYPTVYTAPTTWYGASAVYYPTSYRWLSPTAYVVPTAYYVPSNYYVETAYRRGLFGRWYRERPIYTTARAYYDLTPTSYVTYWPTTWSVPVVATATRVSDDPCVTQTAGSSLDMPESDSHSPTSSRRQGAGDTSSPPKTLKSNAKNGEESLPDSGTGFGQGNKSQETGGVELERKPIPDSPAPAPGDLDLQGTTGSERRTSFKPTPTELRPLASQIAPNALHGEVISAADLKPKANARVVFSDARQRFGDRERTTDAQGRFEVVLPDGDWNVSIVADGKNLPFGTITSAGGRFYDDRDGVISSLRLNQ